MTETCWRTCSNNNREEENKGKKKITESGTFFSSGLGPALLQEAPKPKKNLTSAETFMESSLRKFDFSNEPASNGNGKATVKKRT